MPTPQLQSSSQENLSVVLGRFHAWDARQKVVSSDLQGPGIRELSYEEALAAGNPRRAAPSQLAYAAVSNEPATAVTAEPPRAVVQGPVEQKTKQRSSPAHAQKKQAAVKPAMKLTAKGGVGLMAKSEAAVKATPTTAAARKAAMPPASQISLSRPPSTLSKTASSISAAGKQVANRGLKSAAGAKKGNIPAREGSGEIPVKAVKQSSKPSAHLSTRQSAMFRSALAACLKEAPRQAAADTGAQKSARKESRLQLGGEKAPSPKISGRKASMTAEKTHVASAGKAMHASGRSISVNLRLSQIEHDRMSRAAVAAGLSLAAYIRESTMISQPSRQREKPTSPAQKMPVRPAATQKQDPFDIYERPMIKTSEPGFLSRMKRLWLGRRLTAIA